MTFDFVNDQNQVQSKSNSDHLSLVALSAPAEHGCAKPQPAPPDLLDVLKKNLAADPNTPRNEIPLGANHPGQHEYEYKGANGTILTVDTQLRNDGKEEISDIQYDGQHDHYTDGVRDQVTFDVHNADGSSVRVSASALSAEKGYEETLSTYGSDGKFISSNGFMFDAQGNATVCMSGNQHQLKAIWTRESP